MRRARISFDSSTIDSGAEMTPAGLRPDRVPESRTVVEFRFHGCRRERAWLVIEGRKASVCLKPPGPEPDLVITAAIESLYLAWLRQLPLDGEIRAGRIRTEGPRSLVRAWPEWFAWRDLPPPMTADWQGRVVKGKLATLEEAIP